MTSNSALHLILKKSGLRLAALAAGLALAASLSPPSQGASARVRVRGRCNSCHKQSFEDWRGSPHQTAWTNPHFVKESADRSKAECLGCHAPEGVMATGIGKQPAVRDSVPDSGVDCAGCHRDGDDNIHGAHGLKSPDHEIIKEPKLATVEMCATCHTKYGTVDEFKKTEYAKDESGCIQCHMPEVERPLVVDGTPRKAHSHAFRAKDNPELLKDGLVLEATAAGDKIVVKLTSKKVGHLVPSGYDSKQVVLEVELGGEKKTAVLSKEAGNRLEPGKTFTFEAPTGGKKGKATVRVLHLAAPDVSAEEVKVLLTAEVDV